MHPKISTSVRPRIWTARKWNNNAGESIVHMIQDEDLNSDVDIDEILSLLPEWDSEDCMDSPPEFNMR